MPGRKKILLLTDWFEPGFKAGGIIRSSVHFVQQMKDRYDIFVFTTDRDLTDTAPYTNITADKWLDYDAGVKIFYCSPRLLSWKHILQQIKTNAPDFIYLNSMFSRYLTIYPVLMARLGYIKQKLILAPRGMLKISALQFKRQKKRIFLTAFKAFGLHKTVHFQATDQTEWQDVQTHFGAHVQLSLVLDSFGAVKDYPGSLPKTENQLSIIFIGRLHPVKNLDYLLHRLSPLKGKIRLTVIGNTEDEGYVSDCKSITSHLPGNIEVQFAGEIPNHQLPAIIAQHHIFALPTKGENFGHAIFEALAAGKPVLISDQTPWRHLSDAKAGWDIALQEPEKFTAALQQAVQFNQAQYDSWSKAAWLYVKQFVQQSDLQSEYNKLFS